MKANILDGLRITRYDSFAEAREAWASVEGKAAGYPFQSYGWLELWQETLGAGQGCEPRIVLVERPGSGDRALLHSGAMDLVERAKSGPLLEVARSMKKALRRAHGLQVMRNTQL